MRHGMFKAVALAAGGTALGVLVARGMGVYWAVGALAGLALGVAVDFLTAQVGVGRGRTGGDR